MSQIYGADLIQAKHQASTAQTDTALVGAVTGRKIKVAHVFAMADTAMTVTFESGTTNMRWQVYPAANGGVESSAPAGEYLFETAVGEALTYSSSDPGNVFVSVLYVVQ